jgi:Helicase conserved C-terminal domain
MSSTDIPGLLDRLEHSFDPEVDGTRGKGAKDKPPALDVLLATNMISVGVDVKRLGLMVVAGQPKSTSEYIQATSRVGRTFPGLVCAVFNWARPRDLSHYERFEHYHATFYQHVEPLSITPFAPRAIDRGLSALLVSLVRLAGKTFNHNRAAARIDRHHPVVQAALRAIEERAGAFGAEVRDAVDAELDARLDDWLAAAGASGPQSLGYRSEKDGLTRGLLIKPSLKPWERFTVLNSLRDVEPTVGLILDEGSLGDTPGWSPTTYRGDGAGAARDQDDGDDAGDDGGEL